MLNSSSKQLMILLLLMVSNIQSSQASGGELKSNEEEFFNEWLRAQELPDQTISLDELPSFHRAVAKGNVREMGAQLADSRTNVNEVAHRIHNITPLYVAAAAGKVQAATLLLRIRGININQANTRGATPLYIASQSGSEEVVKLLLKEPEINVNQPLGTGATPLYIATQAKKEGVVRLLVEHGGTDVNHKINAGATALFKAACDGSHGIIRLLISHGATNLKCSSIEATLRGFSPEGLSCLEAAKDDETRQLMTQLWAEQARQQEQHE